jgi:hypothetical protein
MARYGADPSLQDPTPPKETVMTTTQEKQLRSARREANRQGFRINKSGDGYVLVDNQINAVASPRLTVDEIEGWLVRIN